MCVLVLRKAIYVIDSVIVPQIWCRSFADIFPLLGEKAKELQDFCGQKLRSLVWDDSDAFCDIISGFCKCRKDMKWQDRGFPILREMMVNKKLFMSLEIGDFGLECQNMLVEESIKDIQRKYPYACTLAMVVNEYFQIDKKSLPQLKEFDKLQALRDMGILPMKPKGKRGFYRIG